MRYIDKDDIYVLGQSEHGCMTEALRRRSRFYSTPSGGSSLVSQWLGLGSATTYKSTVDAGFMEIATSPNPRYNTWWKLTEKGARLIAYWLGMGFDHVKIEAGEMPPCRVPGMVME